MYLAIPPLVGSFVVLFLADAGRGIWLSHLAAICLACVLVFAGSYIGKLMERKIAALTMMLLTCAGLGTALYGDPSGPERWISAGSFTLYIAPVVLPSFIAACSVFARKGVQHQITLFAAICCVALLLALQPDASQVLGLLFASVVVAVMYRLGAMRSAMILFPLLLITLWAFSLPDPLMPVPYVEEVFKLALEHSLLSGIIVIAAALALIVGLWIQSGDGPLWLSAVAAYYAALFVCSIAGLTPAPLVGYGAGPILGFGLMIGCLRWFEPDKSMQLTANLPSD